MPDEQSQHLAGSQDVSTPLSPVSSTQWSPGQNKQVSQAEPQPRTIINSLLRADSPQNVQPWPLRQATELERKENGKIVTSQRSFPASRSQPTMPEIPSALPRPPPPPPFNSLLHPPLPPPPPPPASTSSNIVNSNLIEEQSSFANDLEQEQEDLQDVRDEVLGARFRLQALRKQLHDLRQETAIKDGLLFSQMRRIIHEQKSDLLAVLEEDINEAATLRDSLGILEVEYEEAEAMYNSLEWKYSRKEARFAEGLVANDFVPKQAYASGKEKRKETTREMVDLIRHAGDMMNTTVDSTLTDKLGPIYSPSVPGSVLGRSLAPSNQDLAALHKASYLQITQSLNQIDQYRKTSSYRSPTESTIHREAKHDQIDNWFFDTLKVSRWDKALLKQTREKYGLSNIPGEEWWREVTEHWSSADTLAGFRTGDSIVADPDDSHATSTSIIDNTGSDCPEAEATDLLALQPRSQPESGSNDKKRDPAETEDLVSDISHESHRSLSLRKNVQNNTDRSESSEDPMSRRTSTSTDGHGSMTSCGDTPVYIGCNTSITQRTTNLFGLSIHPMNEETAASMQDYPSVSSTPTPVGEDEGLSATPRTGSGQWDSEISAVRDHQACATMNQVMDEESSHWSRPGIPPVRSDQADGKSAPLESAALRPPSPPQDIPVTVDPVNVHPDTDNNSGPFQHHAHKERTCSSDFPFVSNRSPFQLPGPTPANLFP